MMNIEIANRLVEMRKAKGLSQEALAEQLGISRQAVSKWERAESSPDTSNLIMLAKLYDVSLDELLNTDQEGFESGEPLKGNENFSGKTSGEKTAHQHDDESQSADYVNINFNGIHVKDGSDEVHVGWKGVQVIEDGKETVRIGGDYHGDEPWYENVRMGWYTDKAQHYSWKMDATLTLMAVCVYLWIGFSHDLWHPGWLLFLVVPILTTFIQAIKAKSANLFSYPVLVTLVYLYLGFVERIWHPTWVLFITIPIYYGTIGKRKR